MVWQTSTRAQRLPKDWAKRRAQVRARAHGYCQATTHHPQCNRAGTECDHITPGDNHSLDNLQWLSKECHAMKTQAEAATRNASRTKKRPEEKHPGLK